LPNVRCGSGCPASAPSFRTPATPRPYPSRREWHFTARFWVVRFQPLETNFMAKHDRMNVKVDADLVRKAKVVAAARQLTLSDYVTALLRPHIDADLDEVAAGLSARTVSGSDSASSPGVDGK